MKGTRQQHIEHGRRCAGFATQPRTQLSARVHHKSRPVAWKSQAAPAECERASLSPRDNQTDAAVNYRAVIASDSTPAGQQTRQQTDPNLGEIVVGADTARETQPEISLSSFLPFFSRAPSVRPSARRMTQMIEWVGSSLTPSLIRRSSSSGNSWPPISYKMHASRAKINKRTPRNLNFWMVTWFACSI
jgi:hypothetical protein